VSAALGRVAVAVLALLAGDVQAEHMGRGSVALKALPPVRLESVVPNDLGIDPSVFTVAMQVRLGLARVAVTKEPSPETPMLRLYLVTYEIKDPNIHGACFSAALALFDATEVSRSGKRVQASTWESSTIIGVRPSLDLSLKRVAEDLAEEFAADYLAANPVRSKGRSQRGE
jgi:hypothetical protein